MLSSFLSTPLGEAVFAGLVATAITAVVLVAVVVVAAVVISAPISVPVLAAVAAASVAVGIIAGYLCYNADVHEKPNDTIDVVDAPPAEKPPDDPEPPTDPTPSAEVPKIHHWILRFLPAENDKVSIQTDEVPVTIVSIDEVEERLQKWLADKDGDVEVFLVKDPDPGPVLQQVHKQLEEIVENEHQNRGTRLSFGFVSDKSPRLPQQAP